MSLPVHPLAGQRVGYARISGASQNLDGQTDALTAAGCEKVFSDTASGKLAERPELALCLGYLRAGDTLVVWRLDRLDRLGRSLRHLVETVNALAGRGVAFASLNEGIDTTTSTGRLVFHIFAALAEFERELIAERAAVGRAAARARGRVGGRPAKLSPAQVALARARYEARDITVAEIARALGVGRGTIYRALQQAS
jgi:DNA invertase Pin-like site-specific DNA recombinase